MIRGKSHVAIRKPQNGRARTNPQALRPDPLATPLPAMPGTGKSEARSSKLQTSSKSK